jgi:uncharacterized protein (TIGR02099 family)
MPNRATATLLNVLWRTTAFLIVGTAVVVSLTRLLLPQIDRYREPIAQWVSRQVNQPVLFDTIGASWRGWTPVIELTNVRLQASEGERAVTRFAKAQFSIDPIKSFRRREAVPGQLLVSGLELSLARSDDGSIRLEGSDSGASSGMKKNALAYWLQTQRYLAIEEAAITWKDDRLLKPLIFSNVALEIVSDGERKQINGRARLPDNSSQFGFRLDATGDLLTDRWSGQMFLEGKGIDPETLLEYRRWLGLRAKGGRMDFRVWSDWKESRFQALHGEFSSTGSELGTAAQQIRIDRLSGQLAALRSRPGEWHIRVAPFKVTTANGTWPDSRINLLVRQSGDGGKPVMTANIEYLKVDDVVPMANSIEAMPPAVRDLLLGLHPTGTLRDLRMQYDPGAREGERARLSVELEDIGIQRHEHIPGISGLAGSLAADERGGSFECRGSHLRISAPPAYDRDIPLDDCAGAIGIYRYSDGLRLVSQSLRLGNADIGATFEGEIQLVDGLPPIAQIYGHIDHADATRIKEYLPKVGVGPKTHVWFSHAFPKGRVSDGGLIVRGPLDKFPFDGTNGRFEVRLQVTDAELVFKPTWPLINVASGEVMFAGRGMHIRIPRARTLDAEIVDATASIPNLFSKEKELTIDGVATGSVATGRQYVLNSPLKNRIEEVTELLADSGDMKLKLHLYIPLDPRPDTIEGIVDLKGGALRSTKLGGDIRSLQGTVRFSEKSFDAEGLRGEYAGQPVTLSLKGSASKAAMDASFEISGNGDAVYLADRLKALTPGLSAWLEAHHALTHVSGGTDWKVAAKLAHRSGAPTRITDLQIESSLAGMALDYPSPLGKTAAPARPLSIHIDMAAVAERGIQFSLGNELHGALLLSDNADGSTRLKRAALRFGAQVAQLPSTDTLSVTGETSSLVINDWVDMLYERLALGGGSGSSSAPPIPVWIDLRAGRLQALGRDFAHVHLRGDSGRTHWNLHIDGDDIAGNLVIPHSLKQMPTKATLSKLHVPPKATQDSRAVNINPGRIPPVTITVDDFAYQQMQLGRGELRTTPIANGLRLDTLRFESPDSTIDSHGEWTLIDEVQSSRFDITVDSPGLGKLLGQFGYAVTAVEGGKTHMDIVATWGGGPADFTLERLHGSLTMKIDDGRFLDVNNPAVGRLFGLLSIQALPKRLLLDFNDLFSKGTGFDQISGSFELDGGNAYTNNLTMRSSSARIEVTGRTGLAGQDYDQIATVTPQISDSLPVASAIFGPAGAAAGAAIYIGKQIIPELPEQIDRMLSKQYSITGSWKSPVVQQVQANDNPNPPAPSADG